jgi:hypothetical protein
MLENFRQWYLRNYTEITWFLIGFLIMSAIVDIRNNNYLGAFISLGLAYINYIFSKR